MELDPELDPTKLNEPGATGGGDEGDDTIYLSPIATKTSTTRVDPDMEEETSFNEDTDETRPLIRREGNRDYALDEIKRRFPKADTSKFMADTDKYGSVFLKLIRGNNPKKHYLFRGSEVNDKFPKTIKDSLGPSAAEVLDRLTMVR